jgi:hypothetical protein
VEITANDGVNTADPYYFASGATQAVNETADITWDTTNNYFTIAETGTYEFEMQGSFAVASSPTEITLSIVQTTGLGGTEVEKINKLQVLRTNIDPHDGMLKWIGSVTAGQKVTCKIDSGSNTVRMKLGSTFTCIKLAG